MAGAEAFRGGAEVAGETQGDGHRGPGEGLHRRADGVGGFKEGGRADAPRRDAEEGGGRHCWDGVERD